MTRIEAKFNELRGEARKGFIPYITAGDPSLEATEQIILELERSGADTVELGVPFSYPMADGPVNQRASERVLENLHERSGLPRTSAPSLKAHRRPDGRVQGPRVDLQPVF